MAVTWLGEKLYQLLQFVFAFDLDVLPFNRAKDGYSPFSALAGFAVAQSVALTAVARGERYKWIVLGVYFFSVIITLVWAVQLLRSKLELEDQEPPKQPAGSSEDTAAVWRPSWQFSTEPEQPAELAQDTLPTPIRAYDRTSIKYGRWTIGWILFVAVVMCVLAVNNLLPNQTHRVDFTKYPIKCNVSPLMNRGGLWPHVGGAVAERKFMDAWVTLLANTSATSAKHRLVWIEQDGKMADNYKDAVGRLVCNEHFKIGQRAAFLVRSDTGSARPIYRQMDFQIQNGKESDRLNLHKPDENEALVIIAMIEAVDSVGQDSLNNGPYGIEIIDAK